MPKRCDQQTLGKGLHLTGFFELFSLISNTNLVGSAPGIATGAVCYSNKTPPWLFRKARDSAQPNKKRCAAYALAATQAYKRPPPQQL